MKKKILLLGLIMVVLSIASPVHAVSVKGCSSISTAIDPKIPNTVHKIILAIQIIVPILLVIFGMLDLFKGLTAQKEDEIKKGQQVLIKRLINAAIVFFVIAIVKLVVNFVTDSTRERTIVTCLDCFLNGVNEKTGVCNNASPEDVQSAVQSAVESAVEDAAEDIGNVTSGA